MIPCRPRAVILDNWLTFRAKGLSIQDTGAIGTIFHEDNAATFVMEQMAKEMMSDAPIDPLVEAVFKRMGCEDIRMMDSSTL